jgi:hypothetical protein
MTFDLVIKVYLAVLGMIEIEATTMHIFKEPSYVFF